MFVFPCLLLPITSFFCDHPPGMYRHEYFVEISELEQWVRYEKFHNHFILIKQDETNQNYYFKI